MKLYLHIGKNWVQPDYDQEQDDIIKLNWTFDDLINPTNYISEYSYHFILPITAKNDQMFSNIRFPEADLAYNSNFLPHYKFDYIIHASDDTISTGEAILDEITDEGYVINLQGSLCTAFSRLLNSGWNRTVEDDDYYLFDDVEGEYLTRNLVKRSWDNANPPFHIENNLSEEDITNILSFIPEHQGRYKDNFDSTSWMIMKNNKLKKVTVGYHTDDEHSYEISPGDGLNEWEIQEFRSYEQPVAVYIQKLFEIYRQKCKDICDYELELDERWYNNTYEYLQKMVYVLGRIPKQESSSDINQNSASSTVNKTLPSNWDARRKTIPGLGNITATMTTPNTIPVRYNDIVHFEYQLNIQYILPGNILYVCPSYHSFIYGLAEVVDENNITRYQHTTLFQLLDDVKEQNGNYVHDATPLSGLFEQSFDSFVTLRQPSSTDYEHFREKALSQFNWMSNYNGNVKLRVTFGYANENTPFATYIGGQTPGYTQVYFSNAPQLSVHFNSVYTISQNQRSGRNFNYELAFKEEKPFEILLKYSKLIGLVWTFDDYSKRIIVKRRSDYFSDLLCRDNNRKNPNNEEWRGFFDITNLVNSDDIKITPLSWQSRYVTYNYKDADDDFMKKYQEKYGRTFGSARVLTNNYINNEEEDLLGDSESNTIYPSCVVQPFYRTYGSFIYNSDMKVQCSVAAPSSSTDGEQADVKGNFYFRLSNVALPASMHADAYKQDEYGNWANISDDTTYETTTNEYCWHSLPYIVAQHINFPFFSKIPETDTITRSIPHYHVLRDGYNCQFADTYEINYNMPLLLRPFGQEARVKYVYDTEWADYIKEIYNVKNKTIEVKASVDGELYRRLKTVPLVTINGVAYLITEIKNWSSDNDFTELTLRQIWNYNYLESKRKQGVQPITNNTSDGTAPQLIPYENAGIIITTEKDIQVNPEKKNPGGMIFGPPENSKE